MGAHPTSGRPAQEEWVRIMASDIVHVVAELGRQGKNPRLRQLLVCRQKNDNAAQALLQVHPPTESVELHQLAGGQTA